MRGTSRPLDYHNLPKPKSVGCNSEGGCGAHRVLDRVIVFFLSQGSVVKYMRKAAIPPFAASAGWHWKQSRNATAHQQSTCNI